MRRLAVSNPFNAPVYHEQTVSSTMDVSRILAQGSEPHGTVITADCQSTGRGRIRGRSWDSSKDGLYFTVLLRYPRAEDIPPALTLRAGLAVALAIEDFAPALAGSVMIKWPNDILLPHMDKRPTPHRKVVGILAEADGGNVHVGIGVNVGQRHFPPQLRDKATSLCLALGMKIHNEERFALLEMILRRLHGEIAEPAAAGWKERIEQRLYKKGEEVSFAEGAADSPGIVTGRLAGIGEGGELLIVPHGETQARSFVTGELRF